MALPRMSIAIVWADPAVAAPAAKTAMPKRALYFMSNDINMPRAMGRVAKFASE
jgi:hypothetical protein